MRPADTLDHRTASTTWSEADLVNLTIRLANQSAPRAPELAPPPAQQPARPAQQPAPPGAGPLAGRVADRRAGVARPSTTPAHRREGVLPPSTTPAHRREGVLRPPSAPAGAAWSVPLLVTPDVEAWLLGWPAGLVTPAHDHGGATVAVTVVEGSLSEECLDPTIWTTGRRTTWRAGASTLFPRGHVHLLGAAGDGPAVAVHAWTAPAGSADRRAGRFALA
jgi:quercetin dioxygenase-like cupin family protein